MFKEIKKIINRKKEFSETAELMYQDINENALNDIIMLDELNPFTEADDEIDEVVESDEEEDVDEVVEDDGEIDMDTPIGDDSAEEPTEDIESDEEIDMDASIGDNEEPESMDSDEMPDAGDANEMEIDMNTPIGDGTDEFSVEPEEIDEFNIEDIMKVTINLSSNTMSDVLPIPPANARDALVSSDDGEIDMNTRIGDGYGESSNLNEAITLDGAPADTPEASADQQSAAAPAPAAEEPAADAPPDADMQADATGGENEVTSAVRDKVAETDALNEPAIADVPMDDGMDNAAPVGNMHPEVLRDRIERLNRETSELKKSLSESIQRRYI